MNEQNLKGAKACGSDPFCLVSDSCMIDLTAMLQIQFSEDQVAAAIGQHVRIIGVERRQRFRRFLAAEDSKKQSAGGRLKGACGMGRLAH